MPSVLRQAPELLRRAHSGTDRLRGLLLLARAGVSGGGALQLGTRCQVTVLPGGELSLGRHVTISSDVSIVISGRLHIGDGVFVGRWSNLVCYTEMSIGEGSRLAERVSVHDNNHVFEPLSDAVGRQNRSVAAPVSIGCRTWLAANVVVTAGATIGDDTVVGANAVVSRPVPAGVLAAGAPAKALRGLLP